MLVFLVLFIFYLHTSIADDKRNSPPRRKHKDFNFLSGNITFDEAVVSCKYGKMKLEEAIGFYYSQNYIDSTIPSRNETEFAAIVENRSTYACPLWKDASEPYKTDKILRNQLLGGFLTFGL